MRLFQPNIAKLRDRGDVAALVKVVQQRDPETRLEATDALGALLQAGDLGAARAVVSALEGPPLAAAVSSSLVLPLVRFLATGAWRAEDALRERVIAGIASLGAGALDGLEAVLEDQDWRSWEHAIPIAERLGHPLGDRVLIASLHHRLEGMRQDAARALGRTSADTLFAVSTEAQLADHPEPSLRSVEASATAACELARLGDPRAMARLTYLLDTCLDCLRSSSVVSTLLRDDYMRVVGSLLKGLREVAAVETGPAGAADALFEASSGDHALWIRTDAAVALARLGDSRAFARLTDVLHDSLKELHAGSEAGDRVGSARWSIDRVVEPLLEVLRDEQQVADPEAAKKLVAALPELSQHVDLLVQAAERLGPDARSAAVDGLIRALDLADGPAEAAAEALGKLGDRRAVGPLRAIVQLSTKELRERADRDKEREEDFYFELGKGEWVGARISSFSGVIKAAAQALERLEDPMHGSHPIPRS